MIQNSGRSSGNINILKSISHDFCGTKGERRFIRNESVKCQGAAKKQGKSVRKLN